MLKNRLSKKQLEVMKLFWESPPPLIASEIVKSSKDLQINTVQACLRSLIKKEYIEIDDIIYSGTVLTRSYRPLITKEKYFNNTYEDIMGNASSSQLMASLIEEESDLETLEKLEALLQDKIKKLEGE